MKKRNYSTKLKVRSGEATPGQPLLEGYGFMFDEISENGAYGRERFSPDVKIDFGKKCFLLRDHDRGKVLARRGKNLDVKLDSEGLYFSVAKLPDTALARETRELIKEDIIQDVSIGFIDVDSEVKKGIRTYNHIELHELSVLPWGYFESGQVSARSKEDTTYPPEILC